MKNKQKAPKKTKPVDQDNEKKPLAYITMERCVLPKWLKWRLTIALVSWISWKKIKGGKSKYEGYVDGGWLCCMRRIFIGLDWEASETAREGALPM